jgi:hypothetical protein
LAKDRFSGFHWPVCVIIEGVHTRMRTVASTGDDVRATSLRLNRPLAHGLPTYAQAWQRRAACAIGDAS